MNKNLIKIDEFNNRHYFDVIKLDNYKIDNLKALYKKNELQEDDLKEILVLKDNVYIDANINILAFDNMDELYEITKLGWGEQGVVDKTKNADTVI